MPGPMVVKFVSDGYQNLFGGLSAEEAEQLTADAKEYHKPTDEEAARNVTVVGQAWRVANSRNP